MSLEVRELVAQVVVERGGVLSAERGECTLFGLVEEPPVGAGQRFLGWIDANTEEAERGQVEAACLSLDPSDASDCVDGFRWVSGPGSFASEVLDVSRDQTSATVCLELPGTDLNVVSGPDIGDEFLVCQGVFAGRHAAKVIPGDSVNARWRGPFRAHRSRSFCRDGGPMRSFPIGRDGWCRLPLRVAYEVLVALVDEADRRHLSPSRLVEQVLRDELPRLAAERVRGAVSRIADDGPAP